LSPPSLAPGPLSPGLFFAERSIMIDRTDLLARRARKARLWNAGCYDGANRRIEPKPATSSSARVPQAVQIPTAFCFKKSVHFAWLPVGGALENEVMIGTWLATVVR
jgi:hypothetical protein